MVAVFLVAAHKCILIPKNGSPWPRPGSAAICIPCPCKDLPLVNQHEAPHVGAGGEFRGSARGRELRHPSPCHAAGRRGAHDPRPGPACEA